MKIYINEQVVESVLEKEKNLGEVFDGISQWIESQGKYLVNCLVDGREFSKSELKNIEVEKANRIDFYIGEEIDLLKSTLQEMDKYVDTVGNTIIGRDSLTDKEANDLKDGMNWIQSVLHSAETILKLELKKVVPTGNGKDVQEIIEGLSDRVGSLDTITSIEEFLNDLRELKIFIMDLINKITALDMDMDTIKNVISTYGKNMETLKQEFIRVNESYQSGKDLKANELLNYSIGRLHVLLGAFIALQNKHPNMGIDKITIEGVAFKEVTTSLNESLSQVAQAMESNDIVQAGDILEYELPEILDSLVPFILQISKNIG
ncbi:MAG: hypothetical protein H7A23_03990 [Leptospiraceae bacterium]|nr:hypothetical protein [Leptospiraceae bacterium]MCP5493692.1 hypothetical protein [Leptospiraceae bacterium]